MRLFISNSDRSAGRTRATLRVAIVALLACSIAIIAASEISVRIIIHQVSENHSKILQESLAASQIRGGERMHQQILLVGNSLLLHDVDIMELNQHLRPERSIMRFAIHSTTYYDWYYGIRGLLAVGSRPDIIVLCFDAIHIIYPDLHNEIFAYFLMQKQDLLNIRRTLKLTTADTFDLLLANTSAFYALRKDIRLAVLRLILPELPQLRSMIAFSPNPYPVPAVYRTIAKERLIAIRDLAASSNIRFLLLVMPPVKSDSAGALREIGQEISVPVYIPLENDGLDISDYEADRYHLNKSGRDKFTKALLPLLQKMDGQDEIQQ